MRIRSHSRALLVVFLIVFALLPFVDSGTLPRAMVGHILLNIILIGGVYAVSGDRRMLRVGTVLAGTGVVVSWLGVILVSEPIVAAGLAFFAVTLAFLAYGLVSTLMRAQDVTAETVCVAIAGYLMLGLLWTMLYSVMVLDDPGAISKVPADGQFSALLYFSFTTLTTLGYGDMVPLVPVARAAANLEAVVGQLYVAITIARLVGLQISAKATSS